MSQVDAPFWAGSEWQPGSSSFVSVAYVPLDAQSAAVSGVPPPEGCTAVRRAAQRPGGLAERLGPPWTTVSDVLRTTAKHHGERPCLGRRRGDAYQWMTYDEVVRKVEQVGRGIVACLPKTERADATVGIYSKNRLEWVLALHGTYSQGLVNVAVYDTVQADHLEHIVNNSDMTLCFVAQSLVPKLVDLADSLPKLKTLVVFEEDAEEEKERSSYTSPEGWTILTFDELCERGRDSSSSPSSSSSSGQNGPQSDSLATIMYTSGTTGMPKGVMLTHGNIMAGVTGAVLRIQPADGSYMNHENVYMSYLPLAHSFERVAMAAVLLAGGRVGFYSGHVANLVDDLAILKPTIMAGVPRVFDKVYSAVMEKLADQGIIKRALFNAAYAVQKRLVTHHGHGLQLLDKLVFDHIKEKLGGRVQRIITGGAPLSQRTHNFLRTCFCQELYQGYGLTETSGASFISLPQDMNLSIGSPCVCIEATLAPVEGMPQHAGKETNSGELWIRGPSVFQGYWKMEDKTREDLRQDGWFKTGDIGRWTERGTLEIVDRKKNIFKLSQGEYVAAEHLEDVYSESPFVNQILVTGASDQPYLQAVVSLDPVYSKHWAEKHLDASGDDLQALCKNGEFQAQVEQDLGRLNEEHKLKSYEKIHSLALFHEEFSADNGLATPTMKLRRKDIEDKFKEQLEEAAKGK